MSAATLSFLRYLAFWTETEKNGLSPTNPDVREVEQGLYRDYMNKFRLVKVADVN
jgi:hypothetical protein